MNTDPDQSKASVANNSNMGNSQWIHSNAPRCGQTGDSVPFVTHQSSIDLSDAGDDERVLDCSDWDNVGETVTRSQEGELITDQSNQGGIDFTLQMSPSTPVGVDGAINPKPAGTLAGKSVTPTVWRHQMKTIEFLSISDVLDSARRQSLLEALSTQNGFALEDMCCNCMTFVHTNPRISFRGFILDKEYIDGLAGLGEELMNGGVSDIAILRFPAAFDWALPDEGTAFWNQLLPVKVERVLFTHMDFSSVYVQLTSGHILHFNLDWDNEDVEDETLAISIFKQIIESQQVGQ